MPSDLVPRPLRRHTRCAMLAANADDVFGYALEVLAAYVAEEVDLKRWMFAATTAHGTLQVTAYALEPRKSQIVLDWEGTEGSLPSVVHQISRDIGNLTARFGGRQVQVDPVSAISLAGATVIVERVSIACSPDTIWHIVGDRFGLWRWHPWIDNSLSLDDGRHRRDLLQGLEEGGTLEKFLFHDEAGRAYIYAKVADDVLDPSWSRTKARYLFPFAQYHARLTVLPGQNDSIVEWTGWLEFDKGIDETVKAAALAQTRSFYRAGLDQLLVILQ